MKKSIATIVAATALASGALAATIDLASVTTDTMFVNGDVITGTLGANVKLTIAANAHVILRSVTINGANNTLYPWAGLTCNGNAEIRIDGENYVKGFYEDYPSIYVPEGNTLTIRQAVSNPSYFYPLGGGTLTVSGHNYASGIGAGNGKSCGNIVIESGIIFATGKVAAGIGGASGASCGDITIKGGVVYATGGWDGAGIGGGGSAGCGDITIEDGVTLVVAKAGSQCENPIGAGKNGTCGDVAVALAEGATDTTDDNSPPTRTIEGRAFAQQYANGRVWDFHIVDGTAEICDMYYASDGTAHYRSAIDTGSTGALVIPDTLGGRPVTRIGTYAFSFCKKITSVTIPASVTSIGEGAFQHCVAMTDATLPPGITTIEDRAFEDCGSLASVTIPAGVTSVGYMAFYGCDGLSSVTIPSSVTSIGYSAFCGCDGLTSVTIEDGVETIEQQAFKDCSNLTSITIPPSVKTVRKGAFENCTSLATVDLSEGTAIEDSAFFGCDALADADGFIILRDILHQYIGGDANVTVPAGVTRIGGMAFAAHSSSPAFGRYPPLVGVTIPDGVASIGAMAFAYCTELESVTLPETMPNIEDGAFMLCVGLADADGFVIIGGGLHLYIGNASTVTVPDGVTSISPESFITYTGKPPYYYWISPVTNLTIPSGVTNISFCAFCYCPELTTVSIPSTVENIGKIAFCEMLEGTFPLNTVHVEAGDTERVKGLLKASGHPVDTIAFVEDYLPSAVTPGEGGSGGGGVEPVIEAPCYIYLAAESITEAYAAPKATTLQGVAYDGCDVAGIVTLKLGKVNTKKKTSKVSGTFIGIDGKKRTMKAVNIKGIDGTAPATVALNVKGLGTMTVTIGGNRFAGALGPWHVQSTTVGGNWTAASATAAVLVNADDLAAFGDGVLADFLPTNEVATVTRGKWKFAKAASVKWAKPRGATAKTLVVDTAKGKTNLSGLKLTYTPKAGTFKGSFKVYALEGDKLKKYTMNVTGVVVDDTGYGMATCKKPFAIMDVIVL